MRWTAQVELLCICPCDHTAIKVACVHITLESSSCRQVKPTPREQPLPRHLWVSHGSLHMESHAAVSGLLCPAQRLWGSALLLWRQPSSSFLWLSGAPSLASRRNSDRSLWKPLIWKTASGPGELWGDFSVSVGTYSDCISPCKERGRVLESPIWALPGPRDDTEDLPRLVLCPAPYCLSPLLG